MPRVPTYDGLQVGRNTLPNVQLRGGTAAPVQDVAGQQAQQMGRAMQQFGGEVGRIALDMQHEANQLRVTDALNRAKETALQLTYDKDAGFTNLKGINALERPDGKPLADEYSEKLQKQMDEIANGLGNDAQRQAFAQESQSILLAMRSQAIQHEAQEYKGYALSVAEGVQATAMRDISLNWNNPDAVASAITRIQSETYRQAKLLGRSAEWQEAHARSLTSGAHKLAVVTALENNSPEYAEAYLAKHSKEMDADDILAVRGQITKEMDLQVAGRAAGAVLDKFRPRISTGDTERAFNIAVGTESGHRQFDAEGNPLTSSAGAVGIAQVMPDTAPEAAKLAGLEWDEGKYKNDPAYNKALGMAYFQKQLQDFGGDLAKAYAAYNAGPGWVKKAVARAEKAKPGTQEADWFWQLNNDDRSPKSRQETQNYVTKNLREFAAGKGKEPPPSLAEMKAELRNDPRLANNPSRLKSAETVLESQYKDMQAALKQADDEAVDAVLRELYANGGRLDAVPVAMRAALPGNKLSTVMDFADKVAKSGGAVHSPEAWAGILSLPREQLANMTPLDFYQQFRPVLDDAHLEKGYALIADAQGAATDKHLEIITTASRVKDAAIVAGLLPESGKPDKDELRRFSQFERAVDERVRRFEQTDLAGKRKANSEELQRIIDATLLDTVKVSEWGRDPSRTVAVLTPDELENAYVTVDGDDIKLTDIPTSQRALIASKLQARGLPITEQRIAELWVAAGRPE